MQQHQLLALGGAGTMLVSKPETQSASCPLGRPCDWNGVAFSFFWVGGKDTKHIKCSILSLRLAVNRPADGNTDKRPYLRPVNGVHRPSYCIPLTTVRYCKSTWLQTTPLPFNWVSEPHRSGVSEKSEHVWVCEAPRSGAEQGTRAFSNSFPL